MFETNQEDTKFQASLGYVTRPHFKKRGKRVGERQRLNLHLVQKKKKKKEQMHYFKCAIQIIYKPNTTINRVELG